MAKYLVEEHVKGESVKFEGNGLDNADVPGEHEEVVKMVGEGQNSLELLGPEDVIDDDLVFDVSQQKRKVEKKPVLDFVNIGSGFRMLEEL